MPLLLCSPPGIRAIDYIFKNDGHDYKDEQWNHERLHGFNPHAPVKRHAKGEVAFHVQRDGATAVE